MIPGFRYHIATIAAIFLALGVGIIIGSSFVQSAIVDRQTKRLEELKGQFNNEILALRDSNGRYSEFLSALSGNLLSARLTGKKIAMVQTGDYPDAMRRIRTTLEQAGAVVTSVTVIERDYPVRSQTNLNSLITRLKESHATLTNDKESLLRVIALNISHGGTDPDLTVFTDENLITCEGSYTAPSDYVVLVGGATNDNMSRADTIDSPLIDQLKIIGATVVEAEPALADISYIPSLTDKDISTVDNADTDIGGISLVLSLTSERGNYGIKRTAQSGLLPSFTVKNDNRHRPGIQ